MRVLFFCILLLFGIQLNAQQLFDYNYNETTLQDVIKDVEVKNNITFSFAKDVIANKVITFEITQISYLELLDALEAQTGLMFRAISENQVVIARRNPTIMIDKVCGYIIDASSMLPVPYATIETATGSIISANSKGFFSTAQTETNQYTVKTVGYDTLSFTGDSNCNAIKVHRTSEDLAPVLLVGYVTSGMDRNKDGSIDVNNDRLGVLPGLVNKDIAQSIQLIPGISSLDESATGIQIRGGSPDQNLILYDDIKLYNTGYFYGMFSLFNPFASENARVYRSGTSASYGDRISGIIDISSGTSIPNKMEGGIEIDGLAVNGYIKAPLSEKVAVYTFVRRSYSDLVQTPTYDSYSDKIFTNFGVARDVNGNVLLLETDDDYSPETSNNDFHFTDVSSKVVIRPNEKNSIAISGLLTRNSLDFNFTGGDELIIDDLKTKNNGLSANWEHVFGEKHQAEVTAYYSGYHSYYQNDEIKDETGDGIPELAEINIRENSIKDLGLNYESTLQLKERQQLKLGYQISNTDLNLLISKEEPVSNSIEASRQDDENLKNALFTEYTYYLKNRGLIKGGVRVSHYSSLNKVLLEPRLNFELPLSNRIRFKTAIERRNQPISQLVEFNHTELRLENNLWRLSDDKQFPLLTSNQISGGLLYHFKNLNIDVDAYYKELKGLTTFTSGFSNPLENLEEGESTIKGLDVLLKYRWNNYKIWTGYTFNDITFQFPNINATEAKFPGNNDIRHQFRISNSYKFNNWQFSLGWQYRSGKPITPVNSYVIKIDADGENAGVVNFGAVNSDRLPDFHRLDATILYDFKIDKYKSQLGLSVLNLYNRVKPLNLIYKAERKPLDDGGIAVEGTTGATPEELELILEQVIQRFSLGLTMNASFKIFF